MMNKLNFCPMIADETKRRRGMFVVRAVLALLFYSLLLLSGVRISAQTQVTSLRDKERYPRRIETFLEATTLRINTTTLISLQESGRALALVATSGVYVSRCKRS